MNLDPIEAEILWRAFEDHTQLWELVAEVRNLESELDWVQARARAETALGKLLRGGLVDLYIRRNSGEADDRFEGDYACLARQDSWQVPSRGTQELLVGVTKAGERVALGEPPETA